MARSINRTTFLGVNWRGALFGGLIGGLSMLFVLMLTAPAAGMHAWVPVQAIAAIVLGPEVMLAPPTFSLGVFVAALLFHLFLSTLYAFVLSAWVRYRSMTNAMFVGVLFAMVVYILNFHVFVAAYPWFVEIRHLGAVLAHIVWGAAAAGVYIRIEETSWPLFPEHESDSVINP
jgi:hypothetical protein